MRTVRVSPSAARPWGIRLIALTVGIWLTSLAFGFQTGVVLLTLLGFGAAVAGLWKPDLAVFGVVILCTLDTVSRSYLLTGGILRWNTFNYWLCVVALLHVGWLFRLTDVQSRLLQVFIALLIAELVFTTDLWGGAQDVLNLFAVFGLLFCFMRARTDREIWYWSAVVSGVLSGLGSLSFYLQQESLPAINANAWSFFPLTSLFSACLYFARPVRGRRWRFLVLLAFVNAGWVFLSGSRGSMLISVVCLLFMFARLRQIPKSILTLVAASMVLIAIGGQFLAQESRSVDRLRALFDPERSMASRTSGRSDLAVGGWRIFLEHPLGVGTGGFPHAWASLRNRRGMGSYREGVVSAAHSGWIKILAENGIPGFLLLLGFVLSFSVTGWRRSRASVFLPGLLVTLALSVAFLADEFQVKGLWLLAAGTMTILRAAGPKNSALVIPSRRRDVVPDGRLPSSSA